MRLSSISILLCLLAAGPAAYSQQNSYTFALDSLDSHLMMTLRTLTPVPCLGTSIRNQVQWGEDTIAVILAGFIRPTPCLDGVEPASSLISLGRQIKATFYLRIREEGSDDLWSVSRTRAGFQLTPIHRSFTSYLIK